MTELHQLSTLNSFIDADVSFKDMLALLEVLEGRLLQPQFLPTEGTQQQRLESVSDTQRDTILCLYL